jgi:hypothetical protein
MKGYALALLAAGFAIAPAHAQSMGLSQFMVKAEALEKKGALALFSSDMGLLKKEVTAAADLVRKERLAAKNAGRKQAYCPPEGAGSLNAKELLAHFRSIPSAQRERMQVRDGLRSLLARKYPCPA